MLRMERVLLTDDDVIDLVQRIYGLNVTQQTPLNSYDDVNIHVLVDRGQNVQINDVSKGGYVLKILNTVDSMKVEFVGAMHAVIERVSRAGIITSHPVPNIDGQLHSLETLPTRTGSKGCVFLVRLFEYVPGDVLEGKPYTAQLSFEVGQLAGRLSTVLKNVNHPGLDDHSRHWNLRMVGNLGEKIDSITGQEDRQLAKDVVQQFKLNVLENGDQLQRGTIHADLNAENIIVLRSATPRGKYSHQHEYHVHGVLDFGDLVNELLVYEIAIAIAYMMMDSTTLDPIDVAGHTLAGYIAELQLPSVDCNVLKDCVCARMVQSFTYGAHTHKLDPSNTYCLNTSKKGWPLLRNLWAIPKPELYTKWKQILQSHSLLADFNC